MDWVTALLFDNPWGLINAGEDTVAVPKDAVHLDETINVPAISILGERSQIAVTLAMVPSWWRPLVKLALRKQMISSQHVVNLTMRMIHYSGPDALFWKLKQDHIRPGSAMMGLLVAGSDTMSRSDSCSSLCQESHALFIVLWRLGCSILPRIQTSSISFTRNSPRASPGIIFMPALMKYYAFNPPLDSASRALFHHKV